MDASFDEGFTSPTILPGMPFNGAIKHRNITSTKSQDETNFEMTGTFG